ncbi:outer membrane protein TOM13-domain-containing protein [Halteromyces radiatus]|uniref:outer membrane protein TOM13-domain-containing protein n=1 Tax=Halteromyces radiatus TaxID=101107 RepID=UPI00221E3E86|nr:outer membrane protein TOM13-domain-containing protein [Halteromyces radiatus]KAI8084442.1 outer membrane protein TOM13-domain-containing protein [Halteromyces radiatus]
MSAIVPRDEKWYQKPAFLSFIKSTAINFLLPFINGVMLGFGEILANELVLKYGWFGFARNSNISVSSVGLPLNVTAEYKKSMHNELERPERK